MTARAVSGYFELSDYAGALRRHSKMTVVITFIGLALAGAYYFVTPATYTGTALVQVNALPISANALGGRTGGPVNMDNEAQSARSGKVAMIMKAQLKSPLLVSALISEIHVAVPPNTTFLQISCDAPAAGLAQKCANAAGRAYLFDRRVGTLDQISSGIKSLEAQAVSLQASIQILRAHLAKGRLPANSPKRTVDALEVQDELSRLLTVEAHINSVTPLRASLSVPGGTVVGDLVSPATRPTSPASPRALLVLPSGLAAGLILGLALAFFLDWRDPRVNSPRHVERIIDVPAIFTLGQAKQGALTGLASPWSKAGQAFTELAQYVATARGDGSHVLLVAGTSSGSSGSVVAANLACSLARTRGETVIICRGLRGATISRLLGATDGRGFADLLAGAATVAEVARRPADLPRLRVITSGFDSSGSTYDMQYDKVEHLLAELRRDSRYVIIDVQSVGEDAATFSLAAFADAAIVVVHTGTSRTADVADCVQRLDRLRTPVLGAAVLPSGKRKAKAKGKDAKAAGYPAAAPAGAVEATAAQAGAPARSSGLSGSTATPAPRDAGQTWPLPRVRTELGEDAAAADQVTGS